MAKLDAGTIKRRIIILIIFIAFVATLFIISSRRLDHLAAQEELLREANPQQMVELFLNARAEADLTLRVLCLTNELKLALSGVPPTGAGEERLHKHYAPLVAEEKEAMDRHLKDMTILAVDPVPEEKWPAVWDPTPLAELYPNILTAGQAALVKAQYDAEFGGAATAASGRYEQAYVLIRQEDGQWRIADWFSWPDGQGEA